jgi:hypothetical protein
MVRNRKNGNDKFYTKTDLVIELIKDINFESYSTVIEPSAGNGSFSNNINHKNLIALDILPENENIVKMNWFDFSYKKEGKILVIGNPPFGVQCNLVIEFFKKCYEIQADTIAFILPKSFKKGSLKNKINLNYHLIKEVDIDDNSFMLEGEDYSVPCIFQVWEYSDSKREKINLKKTSKLITFVKKQDNPNYSFRRVGFYAGIISNDIISKSEQSHYFIKSSESIRDFLFNYRWEHNNTSGPKSIGKGEIISIVEENFNFVI